MSIDTDDLIKAFEALDLMNGQYAESFTKSMLDYLNYLHGEMSEEEFVKELPSVTHSRQKVRVRNE